MHNHYALFRDVARAVPDRPCVVHRDLRLSFGELLDRTQRVARFLLDHGVGTVRRPRAELAGWESGQDHVALYLHNGSAYLEAMMGANAARAVPFNVNYRYVEEELAYVLDDAGTAAVVYHSTFAPTLAAVLPRLATRPLLLQVADGSEQPLLDGAHWWHDVLAVEPRPELPSEPEADDVYMLYTGGTTGMPKGTLWRQADLFDAVFAGIYRPIIGEVRERAAMVAAFAALPPSAVMPVPPLIHGAGEWMALMALMGGQTIVFQDVVERFDPDDVVATVAREGVRLINVVGDAFVRPLCDAIERGGHDVSSLVGVTNGGAVLSPAAKQRLHELLPGVTVSDTMGSSESGTLMTQVAGSAGGDEAPRFLPMPDTCVIDEAMTEVLAPGHGAIGWIARRGPIPLGYLHDEAKTRRTLPVVGGTPMAVPGDRARLLADGRIELLGRDSVTINTGGEKVFAEEVEAALMAHPSVVDVIVVGRPSERWGQEVVAVVAVDETGVADADLLATAATSIARFKLPKAIVRVDHVRRGPAGKADYAWARSVATP